MTKYSGISWKLGTKISGTNYRIKINQNAARLSRVRIKFPMVGMAMVIDLALLLSVIGLGYLIASSAGTGTEETVALFAGGVVWIGNIAILIYFWKYIFGGRVREWHGLEHKLIAAAEHNDVENAAKYSPVHDRCGGTYFLSMLVYMPLAGYIAWRIGIFPIGLITLTSLFMTIEAKTFHQYNTPGIRFGRWVQEKLTVREPGDDLLQIGIPAMLELVERDQ